MDIVINLNNSFSSPPRKLGGEGKLWKDIVLKIQTNVSSNEIKSNIKNNQHDKF